MSPSKHAGDDTLFVRWHVLGVVIFVVLVDLFLGGRLVVAHAAHLVTTHLQARLHFILFPLHLCLLALLLLRVILVVLVVLILILFVLRGGSSGDIGGSISGKASSLGESVVTPTPGPVAVPLAAPFTPFLL
jgi:hypothetical protein